MKGIRIRTLRNLISVLFPAFLCLFGGCGPGAQTHILAESSAFVIVQPGSHDTLPALADTFLGDRKKDWVIADFNGISEITPGREIVIPLQEYNPAGITADGYQTVPVLCYHRFGGAGDKLSVSAQLFAAQMEYLADHGYRVIPLADLIAFVEGRKSLPRKAVVITIDDGYKSILTTAYPILQKYGFPATVFIYTDFIGAGAALSWSDILEMQASGLIDFQPHSKSHSNHAVAKVSETRDAYHERVQKEIVVSTGKIVEYLMQPMHTYAYPYGDTNQFVISELKKQRYRAGVTVLAGPNPSFSYPFMLKRTMIYGDQGIEHFKTRLKVFTEKRLQGALK